MKCRSSRILLGARGEWKPASLEGERDPGVKRRWGFKSGCTPHLHPPQEKVKNGKVDRGTTTKGKKRGKKNRKLRRDCYKTSKTTSLDQPRKKYRGREDTPSRAGPGTVVLQNERVLQCHNSKEIRWGGKEKRPLTGGPVWALMHTRTSRTLEAAGVGSSARREGPPPTRKKGKKRRSNKKDRTWGAWNW